MRALLLPGRIIAVEIEPSFSQTYNLGVSSKFTQPRISHIGNRLGVMGMHANNDKDVRNFLRQGNRFFVMDKISIGANDNEALDSGGAGAFDHRFTIVVELGVGQMAMRIDQHYVSRGNNG